MQKGWRGEMSVDGQRLRAIMRRVPAPVVVITTGSGPQARGMTASSFTSVSLAPPLVSVCVDKDASTHSTLMESDHFVINLLADDQALLADRFAEAGLSGPEQFQTVPYHLDPNGIPVLENTLGWLGCKKYEVCEGGDHSIFLGEVLEIGNGRPGGPLIFYDRTYRCIGRTAPGN